MLVELLDADQILIHPFVIGELSLGSFRQRRLILSRLRRIPQAVSATHPEVLEFIERHTLYSLGIGYVDAHLLAAVQLTGNASLWTRDQALARAAKRSGITAHLPN